MPNNTPFKAPALSLFTRGRSPAAVIKDFLQHLGFGESRGPMAVERNLIKGLKNLKAEFNVNPDKINICFNCAVLRSMSAANWVAKNNKSYLVVGPNFTAQQMRQMHAAGMPIKFFLAPSREVKVVYEQFGVPAQKIIIWPVGIDLEAWPDTGGGGKKTDCLLYFKRRRRAELSEAKEMLRNFRQSYRLLEYGSYRESDLLDAARECRYAAILDGTESQGIAVQSLMACNLPLFIFDQIFAGEAKDPFLRENLQATSVPYWDSRCGIKVPTDSFQASRRPFLRIPQTYPQFEFFLKQLASFRPRSFIAERLSLEKQASEFLSFFPS